MKFKCALYVVRDVNKSRDFYESLLDQKVKYDFGENVTFEGDFSIQALESYADMAVVDPEKIIMKSNCGELYFEAEDLDYYLKALEASGYGIEFIHKIVEHSWGQRVIRFYDIDGHIVEIGECMETVVLRFIDRGHSIEETVKLTQHPESFVRVCIQNRN